MRLVPPRRRDHVIGIVFNDIRPNPRTQVVSLADIAVVNSSIIPDVPTVHIGSTTAPNIPLANNFVTIPMPYLIHGFPAAPQVWYMVANNATFQTLYQAYGPFVL